jgi:hypothetical protein
VGSVKKFYAAYRILNSPAPPSFPGSRLRKRASWANMGQGAPAIAAFPGTVATRNLQLAHSKVANRFRIPPLRQIRIVPGSLGLLYFPTFTPVKDPGFATAIASAIVSTWGSMTGRKQRREKPELSSCRIDSMPPHGGLSASAPRAIVRYRRRRLERHYQPSYIPTANQGPRRE